MRAALLAALLLVLPSLAGAQTYDRSDWPHWRDADRDCQDARQEVLIEESLIPPTMAARGCRVVAGLWYDLYTGQVYADPRALDVDHLVPLGEAHRSGGHAWDRETRQRYANDLSDRWHLVAVSAGANRSKGDRAPDAWLPPDPRVRCWYVAAWAAVKDRWGLTYRPPERKAIAGVLASCP